MQSYTVSNKISGTISHICGKRTTSIALPVPLSSDIVRDMALCQLFLKFDGYG